MTHLAIDKSHGKLADRIKRAARCRQRVLLREHGKDVAALVSLEDLQLIEKIEDRLDVEGARKALAEMRTSGEKPVPYEEYRRGRLGS
ncbi:MAG: prevent-host-death family protein [Planctomycetes bacterium]|nr:prevent-host-death family protein [Planctomycetota bacterium]